MNNKMARQKVVEFLIAALTRALKTVGQTAAAMLSPALAGASVDLKYVAMIAGIAGLYSLATSLAAGLPEVNENGTLLIDTAKSGENAYQLIPNGTLEELAEMNSIRLLVSRGTVSGDD